jgi:hypothetical protein
MEYSAGMKLSVINWQFMAVKRRSVTQLFKGSYTKWGKEDRDVKEEVHEKNGEGGVRGRNAKGKAGPEKVSFKGYLHLMSSLLSCTLPEHSSFMFHAPVLHAVDAGKNSNTET